MDSKKYFVFLISSSKHGLLIYKHDMISAFVNLLNLA